MLTFVKLNKYFYASEHVNQMFIDIQAWYADTRHLTFPLPQVILMSF